MRIALAIISFAIAAVMLVAGIAQRTFLATPDEAVLATEVQTDAPITVIDGAALNANVGRQTLTITGGTAVQAAYGRSVDVLGWVGGSDYNLVTLDDQGRLVSSLVQGDDSAALPSLLGSDLWVDEYDAGQSLTTVINAPSDVSFVFMGDGTAPAPAQVSLRWPLDNSTPWAGPLIVGGAVMLLVGLVFLLLALGHARGRGGPRRSTARLPRVPRKPRYKPGRKGLRAAPMAAASLAVVGALTLAGCGPTFGPSLSRVATPTPTATGDPATAAPPVAATTSQVERIVAQVSETVTAADAAGDATLLATRMSGAALELRTASYTIRAADGSLAAPAPIPSGPVQLVLPEQRDSWPRTVLAIIQDDQNETVAPVALMLVQASARENYKVAYQMTLEPSAVLPDVAPAEIGTARLAPDSPVLGTTADEVALGYADILEKDTASASYDLFQADGDSLRAAVGLAAKQQTIAGLPTTASMTFSNQLGGADPIVLATINAGALVAVNVNEITQVVPTEEGAAVNPSGAVKALSGIAVSTKGVVATYGDQLLFYVPPATEDGKIVLLGYSQGLIKASEVP